MRVIGSALLLGLCLGCGDGGHASSSHPSSDGGFGGEASAGERGSVDGGAESGQGGGAGAEAGGAAAEPGSAGDGGSAGEGLLPDEPDNGTRSGSRLKAEWYDFDGTRVFADFYDTELEAACTPSLWSDGKTYCIPVSTATLGYTTNQCAAGDMLGHVSFNPSCSSTSPGYLVLATDNSPCGRASAHVYRLSATATALTQYFAPQNGACSGPYSTGYNSDTYPVTGEVMASEAVEFTREDPADPGRISRQFIVTADGARLAIAPYDRELASDCSLKALGDHSTGSCAPTDTKDIVYYTDMDCEQPVVSAVTACNKPAFARRLVDRECAQGASSYYKVGDAVKPPSLFVGSATVCRATTGSGSSTLYELGDPVTVQPLTRAHDDVAGQNLQLIYFSDGKKRLLEPGLLYDTAHDTECQINVLPDGTIVCVPFGSSVSAFYDETCTSFFRVGLVYFGADHCEQPQLPPFLINPAVSGGADCSPTYEIRERGALTTKKAYLLGSTCELYSGLEGDHFYELGAVRPFSDFPTATLVRDP